MKKSKMKEINFNLMFEEEPKFGQKQPLDKVRRDNWEHMRNLEEALQERLDTRKGQKISNNQSGA